MTVRSAWLLNPGQTREDTRLAPIGTWTPTGPTTTRAGVVPGGNPLALSITGMTGTIDIGRGVAQGTTGQGAYDLVVTVPETFAIDPGHASQTRYDTVWLVAYDRQYDSSGQLKPAVVYQPGTPGNGAPPTAPVGVTAYLRLWDIQVPAGASAGAPPNWAALLTDRRVFTVAAGAIHPGADTGPGSYPGQWRDNAVTGAFERWDGGAWVPWSAALRGIAPGSLSSGSYTGQWRDGAIGLQRWSGSAWGPGLGEWQTYVPTWTASSVNPILGNGTLTSRWTRIGRTIMWMGSLTLGSTSSGGGGLWSMTLPVQAAANGIAVQLGSCEYLNSGDTEYIGAVQIGAGGTSAGFLVKTATSGASTATVSNTVPVGASGNSRLYWNVTYEAAA
ncbi:hypothetical protein [Kitasatospora sp. NPDC058046]|uniref:hypothetical protein n=1 Tax=Kitasatospora sp. NPDC058046 TaxID=3346312 RepID=UPI0036DF6713